MKKSFVPAAVRLVQAGTGKSFTLHPSTAADWAGQWPTERTGDVLVSEAPGTAMGSLFGYWVGNKTLESPGVLEAIKEHLDDHDVVGVHVIFAFPDDAHSSLKPILAQLKADAESSQSRKRVEATVTLQTWGGRKGDDAIFHSEKTVDVTDTILLLHHAEVVSLQDGHESTDEIGRSHREWSGPLEVRVTDSIRDFFDVDDLADVTESQFLEARAKYDPKPATFTSVVLPVKFDFTVFPGARFTEAIKRLKVTATTEADGVILTQVMVENAPVSADVDATETFAWAAFAENGNVIIWSRRREKVEAVAAKYGRPVVPVIALDIRSANASRVDAKAQQAQFMELLAQAEAILVDGHAMVRKWRTSPWNGNPDNQVVRFNYRNHGVDRYVILTEEAICDGHIDSRLRFHGVDHEGTALAIQFYRLAPLTASDLAVKSSSHATTLRHHCNTTASAATHS